MDIYFQPIMPIEHIRVNLVVDSDNVPKRCELKLLNNRELNFTFNGKTFNFSYRDQNLNNVKNILKFVKKYGTEEEYLEIEKFVFECL